MNVKISIFLTTILFIYQMNPSLVLAAAGDDEALFQCGAVYGILQKVYAESGDQGKSEKYRIKYEKLESRFEKIYGLVKNGKTQTSTRLQENVDEIVTAALVDIKILPRLVESCNSEFNFLDFP